MKCPVQSIGFPLCLSSLLAIVQQSSLLAQQPPFIRLTQISVPGDIPGLDRPSLPDLPEQPATPTAPLLTPETPSNRPDSTSNLKVLVKQIDVLGSTIFSDQELAVVVAPFLNREATFEELLSIRSAVTDFYTRQGYTTSGAFLPVQAQDFSNGIVRVQIVEGELERIEVRGLQRLQPGYVRDRLRLAGGTPLNIRRLEEALQLLQLDPLFSSVQAELSAGTTPGRSVLTVQLTETSPLYGALTIQNQESPSVGSEGAVIALGYRNLSGLGDRLNAEFGITSGLRSYDLGYEIPLTPMDGRLSLRYALTTSRIIEAPFSVLDINGESETVSLGFRQPIVRTPTQEIGLGLSLDWRESQTFLLENIPFSFSVGPENGRSAVTVLRFTQDWVNRTPNQVLAARSQFSLGIDALGATVNNSGTDGQFFAWIGQFQWVQALAEDMVSIVRVGTQLTGDSLLPLEQFSIGGVDTVRGYRQNQRVGDSGVIGSVELRVPILRDREGFGLMQLAPFFDVGTIWNNSGTVPSPSTLIGAGIGLRWEVSPGFSARLDYGIPLNQVSDQGNSLQDSGVYFSLQLRPF